jgi:hypothetical protein
MASKPKIVQVVSPIGFDFNVTNQVTVPVYDCGGGIGVGRSAKHGKVEPKNWAIYHIPSGLRALTAPKRWRRDEAFARVRPFRKLLKNNGIDFTRDKDYVTKAVGVAGIVPLIRKIESDPSSYS